MLLDANEENAEITSTGKQFAVAAGNT